jgi:sugar/nucleoside kinase (ribokinase family)
MRPIGADTGADPTERGPKVPGVLCAVGDLVEDVVVWLAGPPGVGTDVSARVFHRRGGSAANVAALCAANGTPSRFVGQVGDDALGDRLIAELCAAGVDVRVERGSAGSRTGTVVVLVAPDGERTMLTDRGAALDLAVVDDSWLDGVDVLHLPSYSLTAGRLAETAIELARRAKARRALLSVDASSIATLEEFGCGRFLDLLADVEPDVLLMNAAEAEMLSVSDRAPKGVALSVVHRGRESATAMGTHGPIADVAPLPMREAADTTGAGDAFAAGFLPALRDGAPVASAMAAGHECAGRTLAVPGATTEAST